jgi:hypothetical protein
MNCILNQLKEVVDDSGILTGDSVSEWIAVWVTNQPM